jgi:hypothetical protein
MEADLCTSAVNTKVGDIAAANLNGSQTLIHDLISKGEDRFGHR